MTNTFADASESGYGTASYLRTANVEGQIGCQLILTKSRVAPLKRITIPRMELTAACVAAKVGHMLIEELTVPINQTFFWMDNTSVLGYIGSETARFHTFVANRVALIREHSEPSQWRHVRTEDNPADFASRGSSAEDLHHPLWLHGPSFLKQPEQLWPKLSQKCCIEPQDPEVKVVTAAATTSTVPDVIQTVLCRFPSWHRLRRIVALFQRAFGGLQHKVKGKDRPLT